MPAKKKKTKAGGKTATMTTPLTPVPSLPPPPSPPYSFPLVNDAAVHDANVKPHYLDRPVLSFAELHALWQGRHAATGRYVKNFTEATAEETVFDCETMECRFYWESPACIHVAVPTKYAPYLVKVGDYGYALDKDSLLCDLLASQLQAFTADNPDVKTLLQECGFLEKG